MTRRIRLNLAAFALLALVLTVWAVRNVLGFDPLDRPYPITARFAGSSGLQPGFDVTYLGVPVGKIHSVRLDGGAVAVRLDIDKGERLPRDVTAAAGLKSAIGEPYVDLEPAGGRVGGPAMRPGEVIPLGRTSVTESYGDLFAAVTRAIEGLDPKNLRTVTRELARGLDGRGDTLRLTVDGASRLAGTFADDTATLDGLVTDLGTLTGVLAAHRGDLGAGIASTAEITSSLAAVDDALARIRTTAPALLERSDRLLRAARPAAQCMLRAMNAGLPTVLSDGNVADLDKGLRWTPQLATAMKGAVTFVNGKPTLNITFLLTFTPVTSAMEYKNLVPLPGIPNIPSCPGVALPKQQIPPMAEKDKTAATVSKPATATPEAVAARNAADGERHDPLSWLIYLPPLAAGLILLRVLLSTAGIARRPVRRRRNR
ncbi:MCE family protein [Actinomadura parmotrematis]|uniref:MCE family protein n=1 Tax=Actinomadura parmotrematis TaxID=2864039 RepID=A0ABS7G0V9_9ACTN|nr:MCE family protein [Actinomadura parmotrematis]MBW8486351.1 MCE family protein [Actinomadura parmotrematis]